MANVLTFDYLGALGASLLFPLVLVPKLGLVRSAILFGLLNAAVALWSTWIFRDQIGRPHVLRAAAVLVMLALGGGFVGAERIASAADHQLYADEVILSRQTKYQKIVLTRWKEDVRLFLSGHLQFSSRDEHRYHEALVHPALAARPSARRVLILGGGDGLAAREVLKYPGVERVTLVDLDPEMTALFASHPLLAALNQGSLRNPRLRIENADAFLWLEANREPYDVAIVDLPDPTNYSLGKLYTTAFYRLLARQVNAGGLAVVQSTSPMFARQSYWCIVETLKLAGWQTYPYHAYVPAFGEWGFILAGRHGYEPPTALPTGLRFLTLQQLPALFEFPLDMRAVPAEPNRLNDQVLVRYYEREWREISR